MINAREALQDASWHGWPEESDHVAWRDIFESYAVCHPETGELVLDLVRSRVAVEEDIHPADPGIEARYQVLYHGLMHAGNHLTWDANKALTITSERHGVVLLPNSAGPAVPDSPSEWPKRAAALRAQQQQGP